MSKRKEQPYTDIRAGKPGEGERGGVAPKRRTAKNVSDQQARKERLRTGKQRWGLQQHQAAHNTLKEAAHREAAQTAASIV